jgi:serine/threonine-protein kinase RsbW
MASGGRGFDVERYLAAQKAARAVENAAASLWKDLLEAADSAVTGQELSDLYGEAMIAVREALGADSVAFLLANEAEDQLVARASIGLGEFQAVGLKIGAGEGMAGRVLLTRETVILDDISQIPLANPALRDYGLRSLVAVPVISGTTIFGVLHVASRKLSHFSSSDAELLELLGDRLALALERVRLFEQQRRLAEMSVFLAETSRVMAEASDLTATLERLSAAALPALGDICLIDIVGDAALKRLVARHRDPVQQPLVDRLRTEYPPATSGNHPAVRVMKSGQATWSPHMSDDFLRSMTQSEEHFAITKALDFRSYLAVPIEFRDGVVGTLTMVSCTRSLTANDVEFAQSLAQQVGAVVANAQHLELAKQTSYVLQAALLPRALPHIPGLAVHSRYEAASQGLDVGGDFYDLMAVSQTEALFMIGDVEGHDQGAAALMGQLRSAVRVLASQNARPAELVNELRSAWEFMDFDRLATALFGHVDVKSGALSLASAGHYPPLLVGKGSAEFLPVRPSPPLGVRAGTCSPWNGALQKGQILLLYTDGVASDRRLGVEHNMNRLRQTVLDAPGDVEAICERVILTFPDHGDDLALLALQRT